MYFTNDILNLNLNYFKKIIFIQNNKIYNINTFFKY